ncbi:tyrosine-protein phosphatase [Vagococcus elongatus]|uniref:tyrosine-protein phosphatase n=1 Tax=Vagococcus elongatus TaxID=180344 RepID=UPI001B873E6F|nr:tyrosine-protein phosphatase [Vagococcus elongatus]
MKCQKPLYITFLELILNAENLPLLHHCKGGKDRTGFATIITLFALDVSIEEVEKDYMLTKECMEERNKRRMDEYRTYTDNAVVLEYLSALMQTKKTYFDAAIDEMLKLSGSVDKYLEEYLGLTSAKKNKIKTLFLEN